MTTSTVLASPASALVPGASSVTLASVTGAVAACSLVGNAFVFLTIARSKTLQRINNALILSLAVADLLRSFMVVPLYTALLLVDLSPSDQRWLCPLYGVLLVFCELAVVLNVTLIAAERVFVITNPLVYQRTVTLARVSVVIASIWTISLVFGVMQALRYHPEADDRSESAAFTSVVCFSVPSLGYAVFDVTLTLVVPVVTLVVCYGRIFFVVHSQMRRIVPAASDTFGGNSEAVFTYGESGRQTYATRSTSLSFREGSVGHGPFFEQRRHQQSAIVAIEALPSFNARGTDGPIAVASLFSAVRPLSNIEEDRAVESVGHESNVAQKRSEKPVDDDRGDRDRPIRILVTQPSRESINPNVGSPLQESALGDDPLPPGVVPSAGEPELILSPINLNQTTSVSRSDSNPGGATPIRRGSSVTFDLRDASDSASDLQVPQWTTKQRGGNATNQNTSCSSLHLPVDRVSLTPARSIRVRPSYESFSSRASTNSAHVVPGLGRRNSIARINDNKAFKMTLVVVGAFLVCWVPAKICFLLRVTSGTLISDLTFDTVTCLAFVASALDPYVYNFYSGEFRRALKRVLTCSADKPDMPWM